MKNKNVVQRTIIILIVTLASLYYVIGPHRRPTRADFTWSGIKKNLSENINLGLDLKGGTHLVMQVQTDQYFKKMAGNNAVGAQKYAEEAGFTIKEARGEGTGNDYRVVLVANDASKMNELRDAVNNKMDLGDNTVWSPSISGNNVTWTMTANAKRLLAEQAVDQAYKIIDSRLNALGVAEPILQRHGAAGSNQILLQMPGIQDPERVKQILRTESRLELMKVISQPNPSPIQTYATEQEAIQSLGGTIPPNRRVLPYSERDEPTAAGNEAPQNQQQQPKRYVVLETPAVVDGSELRSAQAMNSRAGGNDFEINFSLKPAGAQKFGAWTGANVNQYMAVVLNDEVKSAPFIKSQIFDSGQITGKFTQQSADDLALTLRSGALPAEVKYQEERTVGPSLGAESIRSGVLSAAAGLIFVIAFMVLYYRGAGINAVIALLLNLILTIAALILFKATLTLPGIAGIILSIGMAVDSNVLIFERIREEWQTGKTVGSAVEQGFARAFATIIDTHVTTIVACLFLFVFGTGPIRGFAVTLVLGLLANLFSAVYVSRTIFMWVLGRKGHRAETLSI
jgi:preprotein translocase subunit SecD